jgi:cyclohexanone monooxygenase
MAELSAGPEACVTHTPDEFDVIVVGGGFAGLYALYRLRGLGLSVRLFEAGDGVGGTWYWNRYPGARCDVESPIYSYSFSPELEQEWTWSERYSTQAEILRYINHVADRFDLWPDIQLATRVVSASFDAGANRWELATEGGERLGAQFVVMATGCLSKSQVPAVPGLERFEGRWWHSTNWPSDGVDFAGQRVGVIGTGSTGIQMIPKIAEQAEHLFVFQRTANFSIPANNHLLDADYQRSVKADYAQSRRRNRESAFGWYAEPTDRSALDDLAEERQRTYERCWQQGAIKLMFAYSDLMVSEEANETVAEFVRGKIREVVRDPQTAELLCPKDHPLGTKRLCVDTDYYETYNRANVTLVDVGSAPIEEITPHGLRTADAEYQLDSIVFATGFDGVTGPLLAIDIRGRDGQKLREKWSAGPRSYLGIQVAGFPNLFTITGPGSPSVLSQMLVSIEQHVDWIATCLGHLSQAGIETIEARADAEDEWVEHVNELAGQTLFPRANSWWLGANIPGKPRVFMPYVGGVGAYRTKCNEVAANGYVGFDLGGSVIPSSGSQAVAESVGEHR